MWTFEPGWLKEVGWELIKKLNEQVWRGPARNGCSLGSAEEQQAEVRERDKLSECL